jgi:hypothetical protein
MYVEKYGQVRDSFETKMYKAAGLFQEHDTAFLNQYKVFKNEHIVLSRC